MIPHVQTCPVCARPMTVETSAHAEPPAMPCSACWSVLPVADRAPYIRQHRRVPVEVRSLRHRDPVIYAPPTLLAYIEHLEALIAIQDRDIAALLSNVEEDPEVCVACERDPGPNPYEAPSGAYVLCAECHAVALQEAADAQEVPHV